MIKDSKPKAAKSKAKPGRKPLRAVPLKAVLFTTSKQSNNLPSIPE
ncbi:MAG: hypothetical protein ACRD59_09510 [Candidatus Acidiferrales bacterium]